jgi:hypothetical protein
MRDCTYPLQRRATILRHHDYRHRHTGGPSGKAAPALE